MLGTSEFYRGDSVLNVFGDLFSCSLGYNLASYLDQSLSAGQSFAHEVTLAPLFLFLLIETVLALTIRDNLFLILLQLVWPVQR